LKKNEKNSIILIYSKKQDEINHLVV